MTQKARKCINCGKDISHLHHNAKRCKECAKKRKKIKDKIRHKKKRLKELRWHSFIENTKTGELTHRNAKGSKIRYWVDKICKQLNIQELNVLLKFWEKRLSKLNLNPKKTKEYKTCAGIVKDWRDYNVLNKKTDEISYDASAGVIYNTDGSYQTVDFDEETENYIIRDSEGIVIRG